MYKNLIAKVEITIHTPIHDVWNALVNPEYIKQYLFGTEVVTDWKVGSSIVWKGVWQDKTYEDKGKILRIVPDKLLETTYWSSMSGLPDDPKNYKKVTYILTQNKEDTVLTLTQDNNSSEEEKLHSKKNWKMTLNGLKKLLEN